jgi:hypothetical protein
MEASVSFKQLNISQSQDTLSTTPALESLLSYLRFRTLSQSETLSPKQDTLSKAGHSLQSRTLSPKQDTLSIAGHSLDPQDTLSIAGHSLDPQDTLFITAALRGLLGFFLIAGPLLPFFLDALSITVIPRSRDAPSIVRF